VRPRTLELREGGSARDPGACFAVRPARAGQVEEAHSNVTSGRPWRAARAGGERRERTRLKTCLVPPRESELPSGYVFVPLASLPSGSRRSPCVGRSQMRNDVRRLVTISAFAMLFSCHSALCQEAPAGSSKTYRNAASLHYRGKWQSQARAVGSSERFSNTAELLNLASGRAGCCCGTILPTATPTPIGPTRTPTAPASALPAQPGRAGRFLAYALLLIVALVRGLTPSGRRPHPN
jgi:hypothetical protein